MERKPIPYNRSVIDGMNVINELVIQNCQLMIGV